jgi:hypothetical protein
MIEISSAATALASAFDGIWTSPRDRAGQFADEVQAIYNFPVLISSTLFRIEFQFSD